MEKCCNPYGAKHTAKQNRDTKRIVNFERCRQVLPRFNWQEGQHLCTTCRLRMLKAVQLLEIVRTGVQRAQQARQRQKSKTSVSSTDDGSRREELPTASTAAIPQIQDDNAAETSMASSSNIYPKLPTLAKPSKPSGKSKNLKYLRLYKV